MHTTHISIRINSDVLKMIDGFAKDKEWSRNYLICKILREKAYELTRDVC